MSIVSVVYFLNMHIQKEFIRKGLHAVLAMAFAVLATLVRAEGLILIALVLLGVFVFIRFMRLHTDVHKVERASYGELFFAVGVVVTAYVALPENVLLFQTAMLILAFADTFAALAGIRFGTHSYHIYGEKRSLEGSLACFVASFCVLVFFDAQYIQALYMAVILTFIEVVSLRGSDNLSLPVATVILFHYFV